MNEQDSLNYKRIAEAIAYIKANYKTQPNLAVVAENIHLSPFHFQRLFTDWAGVSPKTFLQYTSLQHAKQLLRKTQATLFDTAHEVGLSGTGRLHDLFIKIEGMTPGEYKNQGENLAINYNYHTSKFGELLVASTAKGVCYMGFSDHRPTAFMELKQRFPKAEFTQQSDPIQQNALGIYTKDWNQLDEIKLHLKGTDFQLKVWETLLKIPMGELTTYGEVAQNIQKPNASRAVGTAIGKNPVAYLIPCHRVIQSSGLMGGYMWGETRKSVIIGWEGVFVNEE